MRGVLRAEAAAQVTSFIARFVRMPVVSVRPLVRVAVAGEVTRAGFYPVPADAPLSEVLMVAHGVTASGDLGKVEVKRDRRTLLDPRSWRDAVSRGLTVDDAGLRDGDAVFVGRSNRGDLEGRLRFLWVVVSLAGGVYGLTRAF
jgi:protein involved in polysaccharide export with SLBB domain